jgi:ligand-binding sensor domain-containing protein
LTRFDGSTWSTWSTSNSTLSNNHIQDIQRAPNGLLWLLHYDGVEFFNGTNGFHHFNQVNSNLQNIQNYAMTIDTNGIIWTGCITYNVSPTVLGGIQSFDGTYWTKYDSLNSPMRNTNVGAIYCDSKNNIWAGGDVHGLVDCKSPFWWSVHDPSKTRLPYPSIREIACDANGNAYIGTGAPVNSSGLTYYDWFGFTPLQNYDWNTYCMATDKLGNLYLKNYSEIKKYDGLSWTNLPTGPALHSTYPAA